MKFRYKLTSGNYYQHLLIILMIIFLVGASVKAQTKQEIKDYISKTTIKHKDIVTAQIYYETAHLSSNVFKANNNLFGMKLAKQRTTTAIGSKGKYAEYKNYKQSIQDYEIWQRRYYKGGNYYDFLDSHGYSTNENYCVTLKKIKI